MNYLGLYAQLYILGVYAIGLLILVYLLESATFNRLLELIEALATPITLIIVARIINQELEKHKGQAEIEREQRQSLELTENRRQEALRQYLQQMSELLITHQLANAFHEEPVSRAAQALTVTVIRQLDNARIAQVSSFLVSTGLASLEKENPSLLRNADLSFAALSKADIKSVNLTGAKLTGAKLTGAILTDTNLTRANLTGANLTDTNLNGAILNGAILNGANLTGANLTGANLTGANLTGAILTCTILKGVDFTDSILRSADLTGSILSSTDFSGADFTNAYLTDASLTDANLNGALHLKVEQVKKARNWSKAKYSEELRKELGWQ